MWESEKSGKLVFALSETEEQLFFPNGIEELGVPAVVERPKTFPNSERWVERLQELDARILVSAWSTTPLIGFSANKSSPLLYVCHLAGTVRKFVPRRLIEEGLLVSNWGELVAPMVAEHALGLILASLRKYPAWISNWVKSVETKTLFGSVVGIHGFGAVARSLVALLKPFDVKILCFSEGVPPEIMREFDVIPCGSLSEVAGICSVFVECEALTEYTRSSIDRKIVGTFKKGMIFVNVGRGWLVDEAELFKRAKLGDISVALDVYREEPLPDCSPWRSLENVILSPHIAGPTSDQFRDLGEFGLRNVKSFLAGKDVEARVTLELYDRTT